MKMHFDPRQEKSYHLLKESGGSTGSSSYLGWGKGCWEAGRIAAVEAGTRVAWGKERSDAKGTEVTKCSPQEGERVAVFFTTLGKLLFSGVQF